MSRADEIAKEFNLVERRGYSGSRYYEIDASVLEVICQQAFRDGQFEMRERAIAAAKWSERMIESDLVDWPSDAIRKLEVVNNDA